MTDSLQPPRPLINWDNAWNLGIPAIDEQHQRLVGMVRTLQESLLSKDICSDTLLFVLLDCIDYAMLHFAQEEEIFLSKQWPGSAQHMIEHEKFLDQTRSKLENFRAADPTLMNETVEFLTSWLLNHILKSDFAFATWIKQHS